MSQKLLKLPIGIQDFEQLRTNGYVYVDKTKNIYAVQKVQVILDE